MKLAVFQCHLKVNKIFLSLEFSKILVKTYLGAHNNILNKIQKKLRVPVKLI